MSSSRTTTQEELYVRQCEEADKEQDWKHRKKVLRVLSESPRRRRSVTDKAKQGTSLTRRTLGLS